MFWNLYSNPNIGLESLTSYPGTFWKFKDLHTAATFWQKIAPTLNKSGAEFSWWNIHIQF